MAIDLEKNIYDVTHVQQMYSLWFRFKESLQPYDRPNHIIFEDYDFHKLTGLGIYQLEDDFANKMYFDATRNSFIVSQPAVERVFYNFFPSGSLKSIFSNLEGLIYSTDDEEYTPFLKMEEDEILYLRFMMMRFEQ